MFVCCVLGVVQCALAFCMLFSVLFGCYLCVSVSVVCVAVYACFFLLFFCFVLLLYFFFCCCHSEMWLVCGGCCLSAWV